MKNPRMLGGLVFGAIVVLGVTVFAAEERPSELFKQYCAKCHGEDGKGDTPKGKHLMARNFTDAEWQAGVSNSDLVKSVTEGKEDMPPFGKKLTGEQIQTLVKDDVRGFAKKN